MHPHLLARPLSPGTWCCPQTLGWAGRQGSCNSEWAGGGLETGPLLPFGRAGGREGAMLAAAGPHRSIRSVHTGGSGGPLGPGLGPGGCKGRCDGIALAGAGPRPAMPPEWGPERKLLLGAADDGEDVQEDVDDVRVQVQCGKHVLLRAQGQLLVSQQQLGVHCQEAGEEQGA